MGGHGADLVTGNRLELATRTRPAPLCPRTRDLAVCLVPRSHDPLRAEYDLLIVGGGAAGLGAARAAVWEGATVALVSDAPLGGDCTFTGCVPSKSLIEASRQGHTFTEAMNHVASVVGAIASTESAAVLRREGVDVIETRAEFVATRTVAVGSRRVTARRVIIATGSRPALPPIAGLSDTPYLTNESFFEQQHQPSSIVIVGGGPVGCELGEAMRRLGSQVTIVESGSRLLSKFEPDASTAVTASLRARGVDVRLSSLVTSIHHERNEFVVSIGDDIVRSEAVLVATGRVPNTAGLKLESAGVKCDPQGWIRTNRWLRTSERGTYAAGDITAHDMLSHAADEMGRMAAWTALRPGRRYAYVGNRIPQAVFTTPEVATIGLTEAQAPSNARVAEALMSSNDRAVAAGAPDGFARLIAKPGLVTRHRAGGRLIGATVVGQNAGELINEAALIMRSGAYAGRLAQTVRAYPSWSTVMQKAAARWFYEYEGEAARPPRRMQ